MALNIATDTAFDEALEWLAKTEGKTKSDVVRHLVFQRVQSKKHGFRFGALANLASPGDDVVEELKSLDADHDLD